MAKLVIPASALAGSYLVTLTVSDDSGVATDSVDFQLTINPGASAYQVDPLYTVQPPPVFICQKIAGLTRLASELEISTVKQKAVGLSRVIDSTFGQFGFIAGISTQPEVTLVQSLGWQTLTLEESQSISLNEWQTLPLIPTSITPESPSWQQSGLSDWQDMTLEEWQTLPLEGSVAQPTATFSEVELTEWQSLTLTEWREIEL